MVSSQFHYTKRNRFMPFLLAEILNFQGSTHHIGVGSFSQRDKDFLFSSLHEYSCAMNRTSGKLEIRCPEVEIIYASLLAQCFI